MNAINEAKLKEAKRQATSLLTRLTSLGVTIKRAQALEGVAAIHGHPDWNHYSAALNSSAPIPESASGVSESKKVPEIAESIYAHDCDFTNIAMCVGSGKSTILFHCLADALRRDETCIFIDCGSFSWKEMPKEILENSSIVNVEKHENGKFTIPENLKNVVVLTMSFSLNDSQAGQVLADYIIRIIKTLPDAFTSRLAYVCADELSRVYRGFANPSVHIMRAFSELLRETRKSGINTKLILSSQEILNGFEDWPMSIITNTNMVRYSNVSRGLDKTSNFYNVDAQLPYKLDLDDRNTFIRNISRFVVLGLNDYRLKRFSRETQFVENEAYQYFKGILGNTPQ